MKRVLVDSSAWISCFRDAKSELASLVRQYTYQGFVVHNGLILAELLQGCRDEREFFRIREAFGSIPFLEISQNIWIKAAEFRSHLRRIGKTTTLPDCLLAAQCVEEHLALITCDRDFELIAKQFPFALQILSPH